MQWIVFSLLLSLISFSPTDTEFVHLFLPSPTTILYIFFQALWLLFLLFSSWLAFVIFEDTQQGKTIFTSFGTTLYQMFILFTTSNNPDVWIPAYK